MHKVAQTLKNVFTAARPRNEFRVLWHPIGIGRGPAGNDEDRQLRARLGHGGGEIESVSFTRKLHVGDEPADIRACLQDAEGALGRSALDRVVAAFLKYVAEVHDGQRLILDKEDHRPIVRCRLLARHVSSSPPPFLPAQPVRGLPGRKPNGKNAL